MLSKDKFSNYIEKLITEYQVKGFVMTKERAKQWYEYFKKTTDEAFIKAIDTCIKEVSYCPSMADIFKNCTFEKQNPNENNDIEYLKYCAAIEHVEKNRGWISD